jgi:predicted nuclease of predicted toxin-antitoxin system
LPEVESQSGLRILLDENMPSAVSGWLKSHRRHWEVLNTLEVELQGSADHEVFQWAQDNRCVIVTFDRDFGDLRGLAAGQHHGIIHLRVRPTTSEEVQHALGRLLEQVSERELRGALVIVGRNNIRVRRGRPPDIGTQEAIL